MSRRRVVPVSPLALNELTAAGQRNLRRSQGRFQTRRRNVLRGVGGVALALPFLELFRSKTVNGADPVAPQRYGIFYGGSSIGMSGGTTCVPNGTGLLVDNLCRATQPLADAGVADVTSQVSGMLIPWATSNWGPGERYVQWHSYSAGPLLSGMRSISDNDEGIGGETSDWVAAKTLAGPTASTRPVLAYRVQPASYRGGNGTGGSRGIMSVRDDNGTLVDITPTFSPKNAYESLFDGFLPPDPQEALAAQFLLDRRKSIVDLVADDADRLRKRLGAADKLRMDQHFSELRSLEDRLNQTRIPDGTICRQLPHPGDDPEIGGAVDNGDTQGYAQGGAWSDEETRAEVLIDLIHMAFACDLSRVASMIMTHSQCFMNLQPIFGHPTDLHEAGHYSMGGGTDGQNAMADGIAWHVKHFANLAAKLRDTDDVDGTKILDNTALVLTFEGGWGYDPEQDNQGEAHSSENMIALVAGTAGGLNASGGQHIDATGEHPVKVINTALNAVGVTGYMGEVPGTIDGLIG